MTSLRTQLWVWLLALLTGIGLIVGASSYWIARDETNRFFDQQLRQIALNIGEGLPTSTTPGSDTSSHDPEDDFVIQIWTASALVSRPTPASSELQRAWLTGFSESATKSGNWRTFTLVGPTRTVQVSQQRVVRDELVNDAVWRSLMPVAIAIPLSWLLLRMVINLVLGRVDKLAKSLVVRSTTDRSLIPLDGLPAEVVPLVDAVNRVLTRLQDSLAAQKRFVADAAHELRTPLAALQLQIGNLRQAVNGEVANSRVDDLDRGVRRATQLSRQLLRLARYTEDEIKSLAVPVDLAEQVRAVIADLLPLADHRHQDLGLVQSDKVTILGDPDDIRLLIANLLENACRYSPDGGTIDVAVAWDDVSGQSSLEIRDSGPGIAPDQLNLVFQPFHRAAPANIEGSGLGLSIVARITEQYGARVTLANRTDSTGLIARVGFPRQKSATPS